MYSERLSKKWTLWHKLSNVEEGGGNDYQQAVWMVALQCLEMLNNASIENSFDSVLFWC